MTTSTLPSLRSLITADLSRRYAGLTDAEREWALERGYARTPAVEVKLDDAESWQSDWRDDTGGSWPCYTLSVTVDGVEVGEVDGWHYVGLMGPDGNRWQEEWVCEDGDGAMSGLPAYDDRDGPHIDAESSDDLALPTTGPDGTVLLYDADAVNDALSAAASEADHGDAPSLDDLDNDEHGEDWSSLYVVRDYRIVEVVVRRLRAYGMGDDYGRHDRRIRTYLLTGYCVVDGDDVGDVRETEAEALAAADPTGDDGNRYESEDAARKALAALVDERLDTVDDLPDMEHGRDDEGLWVAPEGRDDGDDVYHLDDDETARVCLYGWSAIIEEVRQAFGTRAALAALRSWQEEMDAEIVARDPWVCVDDSLAAGNCRAMTLEFCRRLEAHVGATGELGGVRSSVILSLRDDAFTRRACRMAAQRLLTAE